MKKITALLVISSLFMGLTSAYAWGPKGHDIVAAIADQHLTKKTKKQIEKLLDGKSIIYYSSWMDNIQNSPEWKDGYDKTKTWHYANVDKGYTYQTMNKNPKGDVVSALDSLTREMKFNYDNLTDSLRCDYLKMIVHMVGDLHCPMHAGRLSDRGGNSTKVKWFNSMTNIHSVWDSKFIESARKWSYTEWCWNLDRTDKEYQKNITSGTIEEWFNETVHKAHEVYDYIDCSNKDIPNFSYQFMYDFSPTLEEQLLKGGYRLAHILNSIFK